MKNIYTLILVLMAGTAFGQSILPACQGSDTKRWNNCFGTATFKNSVYVGEFKDGKSHGQGTETFAGGEKYVGEYKDDKRNGQGTYTQANGNKYVGEWKDEKYNGQGTYTQANGDKYVGEWKDDKYDGRGIYYSANGSIKESGIYKDNVLVTSQYIDPNSFIRIARNNSAPVVSDSQRLAIEQRERQVELEAQRVAEERSRLEEDKRKWWEWKYTEHQIGIDSTTTRFAKITSLETLDLEAPYSGINRVEVIIRVAENNPPDLIIAIQLGILSCDSKTGCMVRVKFDEYPSIQIKMIRSPKGSQRNILYIEDDKTTQEFLRQLVKSSKLRIELPIYGAEGRVVKLDVKGLDLSKIGVNPKK